MSDDVISIRRSAPLDDAFALILQHQISGLPVVDDQGRLEGVITEFDLLRLLYDASEPESRVDQHWSDKVISVRIDESLPDVAEKFLEHNVRRFPVVDGQGRLVGVVSRRDLVEHIRDIRVRVAQEREALREARLVETPRA
jgi:CBS domain-containing protein